MGSFAVVISACQHESSKKFGKHRNGSPRRRCLICGKTFTEAAPKLLGDMRIPLDKAELALRLLLEGNSIRSVERVTTLHRDTICDLVLLVGQRCERFLEWRMMNAKVEDVQLDEVWGFVGCKAKVARRRETGDDGCGDCYTFIAIESTSKLILSYAVGKRDWGTTKVALQRLRDVSDGGFQLTTDGYHNYQRGVRKYYGKEISYAQLIKIYGHVQSRGVAPNPDARYSPAKITAVRVREMWGSPDPAKINTSYIERFNLDVRMRCRRMTRLTNGFSKSWKHHEAAMALLFAWHNFVRIHGTTKTTPAVAAGIAEKPWSIRELLEAIAE